MATGSDSPFDFMEIEILKLLKEAQDTKVTRIAADLRKDFDVAYGLCLLLSDKGITEELHEGLVPIKYRPLSVGNIGFQLTGKGHQIYKTFGK
jgi:hypothetical protein